MGGPGFSGTEKPGKAPFWYTGLVSKTGGSRGTNQYRIRPRTASKNKLPVFASGTQGAELRPALANLSKKELTDLVRSPDCSPELLVEIALSNKGDFAIELALRHPNFPTAGLDQMAKSTSLWVIDLVIEHRNLSATTLHILAQSALASAREMVAYCDKTPTAVLVQLTQDPNKWVRMAALRNPNLPAPLRIAAEL